MIKKIRIIGDIAVVTATANFHPLRQLGKLAQELKNLAFEGTVLFDLISVNGLSENRFVSMSFIRNEFIRSSFLIETDITPSIKIEQDSLAKQDKKFLLDSVLSSDEVREFLH